jgi:maleylpyruvate isomerase
MDQIVAGVTDAHRRLERAIANLSDDDARAASLLEGWSVGHVLTHLARNAESFVRLLEGARRGETVEQYPGGKPGRAAAIAEGAGRGAAALIDDVRRQNESLESCWASFDAVPEGLGVDDLPLRRWREVEVHHADLGPRYGHGYSSWSPGYLRLDLRQLSMLWDSRRPMGLTGLPPAALSLPEPERLAWLLGRTSVEGLEPAGLLP